MTCSDTAANVYATNIQAAHPAETVITGICSAHNVNALGAGGTITVSFGGASVVADASATEFSGLVPAGTVDELASGTGTNTAAPATAFTGVTAQASELLVGAIGTGPNPLTFTAGTNGTANTCATSGTPGLTRVLPGSVSAASTSSLNFVSSRPRVAIRPPGLSTPLITGQPCW